jgi:hypothetical protein
MANPFKGEVSFTAGEDSYKLSFSANALAELEDALDMNVSQIGDVMQDTAKFRLSMLRTVFLCGMMDCQPDVTPEKVREIFRLMSVPEAIQLVGKAFALAFPAQEGDKPDPRKPGTLAAGTGPAS